MVDSIKKTPGKPDPTSFATIHPQGFLTLPPEYGLNGDPVQISDAEAAADQLRQETGDPNASVSDVLGTRFDSPLVQRELINQMTTAAREEFAERYPHLFPVGLAPQVGAAPVANLSEYLMQRPIRA